MLTLVGIGMASIPATVNIGMAPNHTAASTDLYPGLHVTYLQAFQVPDMYAPFGNPWSTEGLPRTALIPVIGFQ
jgi:hypothetical protein